jgi:hypothetical protein
LILAIENLWHFASPTSGYCSFCLDTKMNQKNQGKKMLPRYSLRTPRFFADLTHKVLKKRKFTFRENFQTFKFKSYALTPLTRRVGPAKKRGVRRARAQKLFFALIFLVLVCIKTKRTITGGRRRKNQ